MPGLSGWYSIVVAQGLGVELTPAHLPLLTPTLASVVTGRWDPSFLPRQLSSNYAYVLAMGRNIDGVLLPLSQIHNKFSTHDIHEHQPHGGFRAEIRGQNQHRRNY